MQQLPLVHYIFDIDIYSKYKNFNNQNLSEIIEENDSNTNN